MSQLPHDDKSHRSRTLMALDAMIESVREDMRENDPGNHATIGALNGELKGLMAARTYVELDSVRSHALRKPDDQPVSDNQVAAQQVPDSARVGAGAEAWEAPQGRATEGRTAYPAAAASAPSTIAHTDHPLRHFDHTCPGCKAEDRVELLKYWRTLPTASNEQLAADIIDQLERELAEAMNRCDEALEAAEAAVRQRDSAASATLLSHDDLIRNARSWATASPLEQSSGAFLAAQLFAKEVLRLNNRADGGKQT